MPLHVQQSQEDFTNELLDADDSEDNRQSSESSESESDEELREIQGVLAAASASATRGATCKEFQQVFGIVSTLKVIFTFISSRSSRRRRDFSWICAGSIAFFTSAISYWKSKNPPEGRSVATWQTKSSPSPWRQMVFGFTVASTPWYIAYGSTVKSFPYPKTPVLTSMVRNVGCQHVLWRMVSRRSSSLSSLTQTGCWWLTRTSEAMWVVY